VERETPCQPVSPADSHTLPNTHIFYYAQQHCHAQPYPDAYPKTQSDANLDRNYLANPPPDSHSNGHSLVYADRKSHTYPYTDGDKSAQRAKRAQTRVQRNAVMSSRT